MISIMKFLVGKSRFYINHVSHLNYEETVKNSILSSYKNIILIFPVVRKAYLYFCFSLYKMVDSKNNQGNFEFLNVSVGTIIGNPEML